MKISLIISILKILTDLCVIRQETKIKKHFCKYCLQFFSGERVLVEHEKNFLWGQE